ncbi:MAG: hypothetical protein ACYTEQ_27385 [Planctomycetota bacterium]|jgi:hypothetical protein
MKKGDWLILEKDADEWADPVWREVKGAEISSTAQGETWIKNNGTEGAIYMIATCRAKVRCAKKPVDKFVTVCEDVD